MPKKDKENLAFGKVWKFSSFFIATFSILLVCFGGGLELLILRILYKYELRSSEIPIGHVDTLKNFTQDLEFLYASNNDVFFKTLNATLFSELEGSDSNNNLLRWSTYKPNYYFHLSDNPSSGISIGSLWHKTSVNVPIQTGKQFLNFFLRNLRYKALPKNRQITYDYELYDPIIGYGKQIVKDFSNNVELHFEFVTEADEVAYKVNGFPLNSKRDSSISIITFLNQEYRVEEDILFLDDSGENDYPNTIKFKGSNSKLNEYSIKITNLKGEPYFSKNLNSYPNVTNSINNHLSLQVEDNPSHLVSDFYAFILKRVSSFFLNIPDADVNNLDMANIQQLLDIEKHEEFAKLEDEGLPTGNFHFLQSTYSLDKPFEYLVIFNGKSNIFSEKNIDSFLSQKRAYTEILYNRKFDDSVLPSSKFSKFLKSTFANLISSLQLSEGTLTFKALDSDEIEPVEKGPYSLLHLSPSRNFFPRGFYWDEGFHIKTLNLYTPELSLKIIYDWFSVMMDKETGYIPRELFLGDETKHGVESKWITQYGDVGNPDVLVWTFTEILDIAIKNNDTEGLVLLEQLLKEGNLYEWFKTRLSWLTNVQGVGFNNSKKCFEKSLLKTRLKDIIDEDKIYHWKGQTKDHCFASGLDDYPRGMSHNTEIHEIYEKDCEIHVDMMSWVTLFSKNLLKIAIFLKDEQGVAFYRDLSKTLFTNLELLNYNSNKEMYCDVAVKSNTNMMEHVCHEGYVSLFPFMLQLIPKGDIEKLKSIIEILGNKDGLYSNFGIRSLSKKDIFYKKDEDYWRSKIWINMNYMILKSLAYYFDASYDHLSTEYKTAAHIYRELKNNILENMYKNWKKNDLDVVFENYNDETGLGSGVQGFTGWSSLIVNILYELPNAI